MDSMNLNRISVRLWFQKARRFCFFKTFPTFRNRKKSINGQEKLTFVYFYAFSLSVLVEL